jgi:hypothetical protein
MNKAAAALAQRTLDEIESLIDREGDAIGTQQKIGAMLLDLVKHPDFNHEVGDPVDVRGTNRWVLATHKVDGLISAIEAWGTKPVDFSGQPDFLHYHGGWEIITMAEGNWIDTFYEPITEQPFTPGTKRVKYVGDQEIKAGDFMVIDPYTPHGFRTGDRRDVRGIMIAYIGALRQGRRMDLDPTSGRATVARPAHPMDTLY